MARAASKSPWSISAEARSRSAANSGRSLRSRAEVGAQPQELVGGLGEALGNVGLGDLRLAQPLQDFAQRCLGNAFGLGGFGQVRLELSFQQNLAKVSRDLDSELRPIRELADGMPCIELLSPSLQQPQLVRVALDIFRQDRNVVIAHIDEAAFLEPRALLVFRLRVGDFHPGRQAAVFEPDNDDQEVAFANLVEASLYGLLVPRAEELHRVMALLHAANGVENGLALLLKVVEGAADEDCERRGRRVSRRPWHLRPPS